jgi:CDP-6-deoxy-D-xylo-4-hexulose-3-dehydrase
MIDKKLQNILSLVEEYIDEKRQNETWTPGKDWISYSGPHYDKNEYREAIKTLLGEWLIFGKDANLFEMEFPKHLGMNYGCLTNSGSSANLLMMAAVKSKKGYALPEGSKIITPVVGFPTTINPIIQLGFKPVFVDVTLPDINLDLDHVEDLLRDDPEIRAITFAHVLGNPPDMDRLMKLVNDYDLLFLEDSCDALGSFYDGKKLGSFGHISTCSFFPAHHMTMGEGGFVATNSKKIRKAVSSLRDWGRACYCNTSKPGNVVDGTACGNRFKNWLPGLKEAVYDHRYVFDDIGFNLKPLDLQASMGLEQVKEDAPFKKQDLVSHLEDKKIQTRSYFAGNVLTHPGYNHMAEEYGDLNEAFPIAQQVTINSFFLGTFIGLTDEKLQYIKESVDSFFEGLS